MSNWLPGFLPPENPSEKESFPVRTSMFEPLELYVERRLLVTLVKRSLAALQRHADLLPQTPEQARELALGQQQRNEFLEWLGRQPNDMVYVALYPTSQYERREP